MIKEIPTLIACITKSWMDQMNTFWSNPDMKNPYDVGKKENPVVLYPHIAEELGIKYQYFVPFEYKGIWYVVYGKLNS